MTLEKWPGEKNDKIAVGLASVRHKPDRYTQIKFVLDAIDINHSARMGNMVSRLVKVRETLKNSPSAQEVRILIDEMLEEAK